MNRSWKLRRAFKLEEEKQPEYECLLVPDFLYVVIIFTTIL